jgi:hypothetical protein
MWRKRDVICKCAAGADGRETVAAGEVSVSSELHGERRGEDGGGGVEERRVFRVPLSGTYIPLG